MIARDYDSCVCKQHAYLSYNLSLRFEYVLIHYLSFDWTRSFFLEHLFGAVSILVITIVKSDKL